MLGYESPPANEYEMQVDRMQRRFAGFANYAWPKYAANHFRDPILLLTDSDWKSMQASELRVLSKRPIREKVKLRFRNG